MEKAADIECFKCDRLGHFQSKCKFKPLCVLFKEEDHAFAHCPTRGRQLQIMGSAISGEVFFCLEFDDEDEADFVDYYSLFRGLLLTVLGSRSNSE